MSTLNKIPSKKSLCSQNDGFEKIFNKDSFNDKFGLSLYINELMREKNLRSSDIYNRANMSRQTWSNIYSGLTCPTPENARRLVIGLKCSVEQAEKLLSFCGMCFVPGNPNDDFIKDCLENKCFSMTKVILANPGEINPAA